MERGESYKHDKEKKEGILKFPEIKTIDDIKRISEAGMRVIRELKSKLPTDTKPTVVTGVGIYTLGYLLELCGSIDGIRQQKIVEVAGGTLDKSVSTSFRADISRLLAYNGVNVTLVDPAADQKDFSHLPSIVVIPEKVETYVLREKRDQNDILISSAFLGGPDWSDKQLHDKEYTKDLLRIMNNLAPIGVHMVQGGEFALDALPTDDKTKRELGLIYNLDVSRLDSSSRYNQQEDFIVTSQVFDQWVK